MKKSANKYKKFSPTLQLVCAVSLFFISVIASRSAAMTEPEIVVFKAIYNLPDSLHFFFYVITQLGSIYMLGLLLLIYTFRRRYHIMLRLLLSGTLAYMVAGMAKDLWGRMRPFEFLPGVVSLEYMVRGAGFPSGHMALATALVFTMGHYLPAKYRPLLAFALLSVGLSRIYLGVHAPLDIVGGFAIGWAAYALFRHVRLYDVSFRSQKRKKTI